MRPSSPSKRMEARATWRGEVEGSRGGRGERLGQSVGGWFGVWGNGCRVSSYRKRIEAQDTGARRGGGWRGQAAERESTARG